MIYITYRISGEMPIILGAVRMDHKVTVEDALTAAGIDMDTYAASHDWDGWDIDNIDLGMAMDDGTSTVIEDLNELYTIMDSDFARCYAEAAGLSDRICEASVDTLFAILDAAWSWDDDMVEPAARRLCLLLDVDFDSEEYYEDLIRVLKGDSDHRPWYGVKVNNDDSQMIRGSYSYDETYSIAEKYAQNPDDEIKIVTYKMGPQPVAIDEEVIFPSIR